MSCEEWAMPAIFSTPAPVAGAVVSEYFSRRLASGSGPYYLGSLFERFAGGGDNEVTRDEITTNDLLAVSMLGVVVPPRAALRMLDADGHRISKLLRLIPCGIDLVEAGTQDIGEDSPAWELWGLISTYEGLDDAETSKILARKRPRLLPVQDPIVDEMLGHEGDYWAALRHYLRLDNRAAAIWLRDVRRASGIGEDVSEIRVFDILVWMSTRAPAPA
jgi:hypothetical protein